MTTTDAAVAAGGARNDGYLGMLAVDSRFGSRGVGRALMSAGERKAKEVFGSTGVVLFVLSCRDTIMAWYQRCGYVDTGLRHEAAGLIASCDPPGSKLLVGSTAPRAACAAHAGPSACRRAAARCEKRRSQCCAAT